MAAARLLANFPPPVEQLTTFFPFLTAKQVQQLSQLAQLFTSWNQRVNLISRKDIDHLWERHIYHALSLTLYLQFEPGTQLLDLGTGGGFPGLPLAIAFPDSHFTLLDATAKKIRVIQDIADQLMLTNVSCRWERAEDHPLQYDFVTGRAVASLLEFYPLARRLVHCRSRNAWANGVLYLKGGDLQAELAHVHPRHSHIYALQDKLPLPYYESKVLVYLSDC